MGGAQKNTLKWSPSVWRARIETTTHELNNATAYVALRMEGEDRNMSFLSFRRFVRGALRMEGEDRKVA